MTAESDPLSATAPRVDALAAADDSEFEPCLLPPSRRLLRKFSIPGRERRYIAFLEERIQRDPRNLRAHVERIRQRAAIGDCGGLTAALIDLNVALGARGGDLRRQLLQKYAALLPERERALLTARLGSGVDATDPEAAIAGALLSRQVEGTTRIVSRGGATTAGAAELAREAVASGEEAGACQLIEEALEFDPGRSDLVAELLALYRRTGRRADFERARTRLLGRRLALPEQWEETAAWFRAQDSGKTA